MPETVFYRGPSGTTIDATALEAELAAGGMALRTGDVEFTVSKHVPVTRSNLQRVFDSSQAQQTAVMLRMLNGKPIVTLDEETFTLDEPVEGLARLLRRVLPEPAKVISIMSDEQWADFHGAKA